MIVLTQLVYVRPGREATFDEFEAVALPLVAKHGGSVMLRLRPGAEAVIEAGIEVPYEVHVVSFPDDAAFARFAADEERQRFLRLKEESVRSALLVKGTPVG